MIGELRYAAQFYSRMLKRLRIFPATLSDADKLAPIESGPPVQILDRIQDPGGGRTSLLGNYGRLMFITGEGYLFGRGTADGERWSFVWRDELKFDDTGRITHVAAPGLPRDSLERLPDSSYDEIPPDSAVAYRMWTPHPRFSAWPDSPMRAILGEAEELLILSRSVHATATSRLVRAPLLLVPDELSFAPVEPVGDEDALNDPLLADLIEGIERSIEEPGSAASMVPNILRGMGELLPQVRTLFLHDTQSDYLERDLRTETIKRIALGLDMPPEVLLGLTDANHWSAWQIAEDMWRSHGAPIAEQFCDDLSEAYLRPALREIGYEGWEETVVAYDESAVVVDPDRSKNASEAWDRGAIGYKPYRTALNFTEDDAQDEDEHREWLAVKLKDPAAIPEFADVNGAPNQNGGPPPGQPGPVSEQTNLPQSANVVQEDARIRGAAELALMRCRELAGARLRRYKDRCKDCFDGSDSYSNALVAAFIGPENVERLGAPEPQALVAGGTDTFCALLASWGYPEKEARTIANFLELYAARTLFHDNPGVPSIPTTKLRAA